MHFTDIIYEEALTSFAGIIIGMCSVAARNNLSPLRPILRYQPVSRSSSFFLTTSSFRDGTA